MNKPENFPASKQDFKTLFDELNKVWEKSSYTFITVDTQTKLRILANEKHQQIEHFAAYAFDIFKSYYYNKSLSQDWYNDVHINKASYIDRVELYSKKEDMITLKISTHDGHHNHNPDITTLLIPYDMLYNPREYENTMRNRCLGYLEDSLLTLKQEVEDKETRIHNIKRSLALSKD